MTIYNYEDKRKFSNLYLSISYYFYVFLKNVSFSFILIVSFYCLIHFKNKKDLENTIRYNVLKLTYPYELVVKIIDYGIDYIKNYFLYFINLKKFNKDLIQQNFDLKVKLFRMNLIEKENSELKKIINITFDKENFEYTVSKINIISKSSFINKIEINSNEKIKNNDIVVDKNGNLVGKIINNNEKKAEILLLSDNNFKIGALLGKSMVKVILSGNSSNLMNINYFLGEKFNILDNEKVYTSNDGNVNQDGIFIGNIVKKDSNFYVKFASNLSNINYVVILHKIKDYKEHNNLNVYDVLKKEEGN